MVVKVFLKLPNLHMLIKKSPSLPRNLVFRTSGKLPIVVSIKVNIYYTIPPLFNGPEVLPFVIDKAKLFAENFSKNSNFDDSGISLHVFPSRTYLKQHNISIISKMVKKVITNLDL